MKHVVDVMTTSLVGVDPVTSILDAEMLASRANLRHLVVFEREERPGGIVCVCDLERAHRGGLVRDVMSHPVETIWANATVEQAAILMRQQRVGCLVALSEGRACGIVTRRDLRRAGLTQEQTGGGECLSCKTHHDLRSLGGIQEVCFCSECLDRAAPEGYEEEVGGGD